MNWHRVSSPVRVLRVPVLAVRESVLFPHTVLAVGISRQPDAAMIRDAMEADRAVGVILVHDFQKEYGKGIRDIGTLGRIQDVGRSAGGRMEVLVRGIRRFRVVHFLRPVPYPRAKVQLLQDRLPAGEEIEVLRGRLIEAFQRWAESGRNSGTQLKDLAELENLDFAALVNSIAGQLGLGAVESQTLLELDSLSHRALVLLDLLLRRLSEGELVSELGHLRPRDPRVN